MSYKREILSIIKGWLGSDGTVYKALVFEAEKADKEIADLKAQLANSVPKAKIQALIDGVKQEQRDYGGVYHGRIVVKMLQSLINKESK